MPPAEVPQLQDAPEALNPPEKQFSIDELRDRIIELDVDDTIWRRKELAHRELAASELDEIEWEIDQLKQRYGDGPEFKDVEAMYQDLRADYDNENELKLDRSLGMIAEEIHQEIVLAGIKQSPVGELPEGALRDLGVQLEELGVKVEYVVAAPRSDAPVVILIPQIHGNPGMSEGLKDAAGVTQNQSDIRAIHEKLVGVGLVQNAFAEGVPAATQVTLDMAALNPHQGWLQAKREMDSKLTVHGFEHWSLYQKTILDIDDPIESILRQTVANIYIADAIERQVDQNGIAISTVVIGAGHELNMGKGGQHPFPLSQTLAFIGVNVIVVNRPHLDVARLKAYQEAHPEDVMKTQAAVIAAGMTL